MTTIAYCNKRKIIAADSQLNFDNYAEFCVKIIFPKRGVVLAAAGDAGQGEWVAEKITEIDNIKQLFKVADPPKLKDFEAFLWWGKPYILFSDLCPIPIEGGNWVCGTGGAFALAHMRNGLTPYEAAYKAALIDPNSSPPIHWIDLRKTTKKIETYNGEPVTIPTEGV